MGTAVTDFALPDLDADAPDGAAQASRQARELRDAAQAPPETPARPKGGKSAPKPKAQGPRSRPGNAGGAASGTYKSRADLMAENAELAERLARVDAARDSAEGREDMIARLVAPLAMTARVAADLVARTTAGPWWRLEDAEADALAQVWAPVLAPRASTYAENLPLMAAVMVTVQVCAPRLDLTLRARRGELPTGTVEDAGEPPAP